MSISNILESLTVTEAPKEALGFGLQPSTKKEPSAASILLAEKQRARENLPLEGDFIRLRTKKPNSEHDITDALLTQMTKSEEEPVYGCPQPQVKKQQAPQCNGSIPLKKKRAKEQKGEAYKDRLEERLVSKGNRKNRLNKLKSIY